MKPRSFKDGDELNVHVGRLWSAVAAPMPYDFYSLNWCDSTAGHTWDGGHKRQNKMTYDHDDSHANENLHESPFSFKIGQ